MKPTKLVITVPIMGWSKEDDITKAEEIIVNNVRKLFVRLDKLCAGASPFNASRITAKLEEEISSTA